jgi:hypothetical protein
MNFETIIIYGLVIANSVGVYLMQKYVRQAIKDLRNDVINDIKKVERMQREEITAINLINRTVSKIITRVENLER